MLWTFAAVTAGTMASLQPCFPQTLLYSIKQPFHQQSDQTRLSSKKPLNSDHEFTGRLLFMDSQEIALHPRGVIQHTPCTEPCGEALTPGRRRPPRLLPPLSGFSPDLTSVFNTLLKGICWQRKAFNVWLDGRACSASFSCRPEHKPLFIRVASYLLLLSQKP